jgi:hypothetical protein
MAETLTVFPLDHNTMVVGRWPGESPRRSWPKRGWSFRADAAVIGGWRDTSAAGLARHAGGLGYHRLFGSWAFCRWDGGVMVVAASSRRGAEALMRYFWVADITYPEPCVFVLAGESDERG